PLQLFELMDQFLCSLYFFFSSRRRHTISKRDWSSDVCSSDLPIYFNSNEILAIFFALKSLDLLSSTPFEKSYKQIREKLFATIPVQQQQNISKTLNFIHYHNISPINNSENLATILQSIMNENTVTITYTQIDSIQTEIQI